MLKAVAGVIAGIVAGFVAVLLAQMVVSSIYPLPPGVDVFNAAQMADVFRSLPAGHFVAILVTYLIGGFVGGYVARLIARRDWAVWVPAGLIALTAAFNVFTYPHPVWAEIGGILAPLIGGWLARLPRLATRRDAAERRADAEI